MNKNIQCYFFGNLKMFNKIQWVDTQTRYGNYFTYQKNCSSTTFVTQKKTSSWQNSSGHYFKCIFFGDYM